MWHSECVLETVMLYSHCEWWRLTVWVQPNCPYYAHSWYSLSPPSEQSEWRRSVFVPCVCLSVCLSVCSRPVNQTSLKLLKLRTSNLTCMFPGTVRTWPVKFFSKRGVCRNSLGGDMHSHECLFVFICNFMFIFCFRLSCLFAGI